MAKKKATPIKRTSTGQFVPGQSGCLTGRPVGAKTAISKEFREMSYQAFLELGGVEWIKKVAKTKKNAASVLNFFSKLMPRDINIDSEKPIPIIITSVVEDLPDDEDQPTK